MTNRSNNNSSSNNHVQEDARHASNNNTSNAQHRLPPPPPLPVTKKQALMQRKRQLKQQSTEEREPWLFQSLNFQPALSLPALPPVRQDKTSAAMSLSPSSGRSCSSLNSISKRQLFASASSPSPLSAFTDLDTTTFGLVSSSSTGSKDSPFFLDVDSLKRLLPHSCRPRPSSSDAAPYGSLHQSNNNRPSPQHSGRRVRHATHVPARLEALSGVATARRKTLKRKANASVNGASSATTTATVVSTRKNALRMDGGKGRAAAKRERSSAKTKTKRSSKRTAAAAAMPRRHVHEQQAPPAHAASRSNHSRQSHRHARTPRRSSYAQALACNSDASDDDDGDDVDVDALDAMEDADEATRMKCVIAAQLNLTLEEYEALDAAFGGDRTDRVDSDDDDDDDRDGSMTARYHALFAQYDADSSGAISPTELRDLLRAAGEDMDDAELATVLAQADANHDGEIDFSEFVDLMRARKRLLRVANHMGVSGVGPDGGSGTSIGHHGPQNSQSHQNHQRNQNQHENQHAHTNASPLPPLKLATLQSKKHTAQFGAHFTRPTPSCLRPGAAVDLTELRRELAVSEFGIQELNAKVRDGLEWVQQHCPVRSLKAQVFCHRWGVEKVVALVHRMQSAALARAMRKWIAFMCFERNKVQANRFLKCKGSQKLRTLMTTWRRKTMRRRFRLWRTVCVRDARNELHSAAIELQRVARGFTTRCALARQRAIAAATRMQALVRGHLARCLAARMRRSKLEHASASLLQRCYRGYTGKRIAHALFIAQREALAARRIQRAFRNHARRELLRVIQQTKYEHDCAVRIQYCARCYVARQERLRRIHKRRCAQAATVIARYVRGYFARCLVARMRCREAAATRLQRWLRAVRARMLVHAMRCERLELAQRMRESAAATTIQTYWRRHASHQLVAHMRLERAAVLQRRVKQRETSACLIQCAFRRYCARCTAQRLRFDRLQALDAARRHRSALRIQACWRGFHGRFAAHLRLHAQRALESEAQAAALRIQSVARRKLAKRELDRRLQSRARGERNDARQNAQREQAAVRIQALARGRQARVRVTALRHQQRVTAQQTLARLTLQTRTRAAVTIQSCMRRCLACMQYTAQAAAQAAAAAERERLAEAQRVREHAALVIQCAMRRAQAQRLMRQRRHDLEKRLSLMASEKAHDEIERLRAEQEDELRKLKAELQAQQRAASDAAETLRLQVERERADTRAQREVDVAALATLQAQALVAQQQQQQRDEAARQRQLENERLRDELAAERVALEQQEALARTRENEALTTLKLAPLLSMGASSDSATATHQQKLEAAALAMRRDQARLCIQSVCLRYLARRRLERLQQTQQQQLAALQDATERARLQSVQEQELALAKLKTRMDDETRAREQEVQALELAMLERARVEQQRIATRHAAARTIQRFARGFAGRTRARIAQQQIERDRDARARVLETTLADAEAKVAQALADNVEADAIDRGSTAIKEEANVSGSVEDVNDTHADGGAADDTIDAAAATDEWVEYWDENAQASYYYNVQTQEASWTRPADAFASTTETPALDHEQDSYAGAGVEVATSDATAVDGYAESYADQYGYYDAYGQYHYYEVDPSAAAATAAAFANAQMAAAAAAAGMSMNAGAYSQPPAPTLLAYQAAMASMMMMGYANNNPLMMMQQPYTNSAMPQQELQYASSYSDEAPVTTDASDAAAAAAPPPDPWEQFYDQYTGAAYYYNSITGEKYWA